MLRMYQLKKSSRKFVLQVQSQEVNDFCAADIMHGFEDGVSAYGFTPIEVSSREEASKHFISEFCTDGGGMDAVIICDIVNSGMNKEIVAYLPPIYKYEGYTWRVVTTEPFKNSQSGNKVTVTTITRSKSTRRR